MALATSSTRLALGSHSSLEHYGRLVKFLALDFGEFVSVNPALRVEFCGFFIQLLACIFAARHIVSRVITHTVDVTSMSV
jgi:hypothetical protein